MKLHQQDGICHVCEQPATFKAPYDLCSQHWAVWWGGDDTHGYMYQQAVKHVHWRDLMSRVPRFMHGTMEWTRRLMERMAPHFERHQTVLVPYPNLKVRNRMCKNGHRIPEGTWCYECE